MDQCCFPCVALQPVKRATLADIARSKSVYRVFMVDLTQLAWVICYRLAVSGHIDG
jgi:hypothetical protein